MEAARAARRDRRVAVSPAARERVPDALRTGRVRGHAGSEEVSELTSTLAVSSQRQAGVLGLTS